MDEISSHTGASRGSIYFHFKSKEELYLYTLKESVRAWRHKWEEQSRGLGSTRQKLELLAEIYAEDMQSRLSKTVTEYLSAENFDEAARKNVIQLMMPEFDVFRRVIDEGIRSGQLKSDHSAEELAHVLYGMLHGLYIANYIDLDQEKAMQNYRTAVRVFLDGAATT